MLMLMFVQAETTTSTTASLLMHNEIYIRSNWSDLFIIRPDGTLRGSVNVGPIARTPCFHESFFYVANGDGCLLKFDIETLELVWRKKLAVSVVWDSPAGCTFAEGLILAGFTFSKRHTNGMDVLIAVRADSGEEVWRYNVPLAGFSAYRFDGPYNVMPGIIDGKVCFADTHKGICICLSLATGEELWRHVPDTQGLFSTSQMCVGPNGMGYNCWNPRNPETEDGKGVGGGPNGYYCSGGIGRIDAYVINTGELKWTKTFELEAFIMPVVVPPHLSGTKKYTVLMALGSNCGEPKDIHPNWVHPGTGDRWLGKLVSLDGETGEEVWSWSPPVYTGYCYFGSDKQDWYLPDAWGNPPVIGADGTIYASFMSGSVFSINAATGECLSKYNMKGCSNGNCAIAPGLVACPCQFGVYIWRDAALEAEWCKSGDARTAGFSGVSVGGPWDDPHPEWFLRTQPSVKDLKYPAALVEDFRDWSKLREKLSAETLKESMAWSEEMRIPLPLPAADADANVKSGPGTVWQVVGGGLQGGIVVRSGEGLKTKELGRISKGAELEEIERDGDRVHYKKLAGDGPDFGWVSRTFKGTPLLEIV